MGMRKGMNNRLIVIAISVLLMLPLMGFSSSVKAFDAAQSASAGVASVIKREIPSERLSGTLAVSPNPVYCGQEVSFLSTINNSADTLITGITVRVLIIDPKINETKMTLEKTGMVPPKGSASGSLTSSTAELTPQVYQAQLQVVLEGGAPPKTLAAASLEVLPVVDVTEAIKDPINLLVWVNEQCDRNQGNTHEGIGKGRWRYRSERCIKIELLQAILTETVGSYLIVSDSDAFAHELRNPYFTDILILGDQEPLPDHVANELQERVYAGTGLISSLWLEHGLSTGQGDDPLFGVRYKGQLFGNYHTIATVPSPITDKGTIKAEGKANRVEAFPNTTIAGWIDESSFGYIGCRSHGHDHDSQPGICINDYGLGKAIYFAFDLGLSLDTKSCNQIALLLKNALVHVHKKLEAETFLPYQLVPIDLTIQGMDQAIEAQITEAFPPTMPLYDPATGKWITQSPWAFAIALAANQIETIRYYALMPDTAGTYVIETQVGFTAQGTVIPAYESNIEITVEKDAAALAADIIDALNGLSVSKKDRAMVQDAIKWLQQVQHGHHGKKEECEDDIHDILKAVDAVVQIGSADITQIRLMLDNLLRVEEGRCYFSAPNEHGKDH
jgi:hypothetical protein